MALSSRRSLLMNKYIPLVYIKNIVKEMLREKSKTKAQEIAHRFCKDLRWDSPVMLKA